MCAHARVCGCVHVCFSKRNITRWEEGGGRSKHHKSKENVVSHHQGCTGYRETEFKFMSESIRKH